MGAVKRKPAGSQVETAVPPGKKLKRAAAPEDKKKKLTFDPRPDWHAAELPSLQLQDAKVVPPQRTIDSLQQHATQLLEAENAAYNASHLSGSSSHKFLATIMSSGTLEDKISALTLLVQESPLHTMKAFDNLLALSKKRSRNQALMAVAALKDLLGQGVVLPSDRKLRAFAKQPSVLGVFQGKNAKWSIGDPLPAGIEEAHLLVWAFEDWLKKAFFQLLQVLEGWCNDEVEYARSRAITYVWELLRDKPEQEENLLRLLINKLGDTDRKIASRTSYLLLQLETSHPAMKMVITNSIESDCLFRPGQSIHAKYYAVITLNQTILSQKEEEVANKLLEIYFALFVQLLKHTEKDSATSEPNRNKNPLQGGGGKAGKMALKKQKALERADESEDQLREKMIAQVLSGVNRAFPFADASDPNFEKQLDTIFRVTHSANFNTSVQALMLLQQISSTKHFGAERFYRTLYDSLLDPRLVTSSKQVLYLNLLFRSLKADLNAKRVQAFVKRLLQVITLHEPPFVCGVLYLISELETNFPSIRNMMTEPEVEDEDEEEHFVDVPETNEDNIHLSRAGQQSSQDPNRYDPRKRDPTHAHAERSCLWELLPFLKHFHPSVSLFADAILYRKTTPQKPDPATHSLMHFLDRFVYRNPKSKEVSTHGISIMQPMAGSNAADLLVRPGDGSRAGAAPVNSEQFWQRKVENVAADEVFFHSYFNQTSNKKKSVAEKKQKKSKGEDSDEDSEDEGEAEIWEAIASSRPDVEGPSDDDDDISLADLESAYSDSDAGSEAGIDLGGDESLGDQDGDVGLALDGPDADALDEMPEFDSDEDAFLDDDDEIPVLVENEEDEKVFEKDISANKKRRQEKKKLKSLPTFASVDDYAKLLADEPDDV
nr:ribosome biogenesis protein noc1 [Quercus suber]